MNKILAALIFALAFIATAIYATSPTQFSDQATNVVYANGTGVNGNLTIEVWDSLAGGSMLYAENFTDAVVNGTWNVEIGTNASNQMNLTYGTKYYRSYYINGNLVTMTTTYGVSVIRKEWMSPLGSIPWLYVISNGQNASFQNLNVTGNENISTGNLYVVAGNITYTDRNSKTRVIQDTTQGEDELKTNTLLDKSRSTLNCTGGILNYTLLALNGVGEWNFGGVFYGNTLSVASASINLLNGTNATPKSNFVYFYLNGATPTLAVAESHPTNVHIDVATFVVGETSGSSCVVYSYSRSRDEIDSFVSRVITRMSAGGTFYSSGFTTTAATKNIAIASGSFYNGIFYMFSNISKNSTTDGFYLINSTGNFLQKATFDSNTFNQYQTGETVTDDRYVNVIWGVVPTTTTASGTTATVMKIVAVVQSKPATEYTTTALAEQDLYEMTNYYPSNAEVKTVFTPIARTVVRYRTGGGGTGTLQTLSNGQLFRFIAGGVSSSGASPSPSTSDHSILTNLDYSVAGHTGFASTTYADGINNALNATKAQAGVCAANEWMQSTTNTSAPTCLQVGFTNVSGTVTDAQMANQKLNVSDVGTAIGNSTIARTGTATCAGVTLAQNVTTTTSGMTSQCLTIPTYVNDTWQADKSSYTATTGIATLMGNSTIARTGASSSCTGAQAVQTVTTATTGTTTTCITPPQGTVTSLTCGYGMNTSTITTSGTCNANDSVLQNRIPSTCTYGIASVAQNGTATCAAQQGTGNGTAATGTATCAGVTVAQNVTTTTTGTTSQCITPPQGTVTSVTCNGGLTGGAITGSGTCALNTTGTAGTYGGANAIPVITTDANGRVSGVTTSTPAIPASEVTEGTFGAGNYTFPANVSYAAAEGCVTYGNGCKGCWGALGMNFTC